MVALQSAKVSQMCLVCSWHGSSVNLYWFANHKDNVELFQPLSCSIWEPQKLLVLYSFLQAL